MGTTSAETYEFRRGEVKGDGTCLFWSALVVFELPLEEMCNEDLRIRVANHIRENEDMHYIVRNITDKPRTVEEYCDQIEQGKLWGGEPEFKSLSSIFNKLICKISVKKDDHGGVRGWRLYYGLDNPSATECVYILHDEDKKHFEPLYMVNIQNENDKKTKFDPNDDTVNALLRKFLGCNNLVEFGTPINVNEVSHPGDDSSETKSISNSIRQNESTKRKQPEVDDIVSPANNNKPLPISIWNKCYIPNKRVKTSETSSDEMSTFYKKNSESLAMEKLLQTDFFADESVVESNQEPLTDVPVVANDGNQEEENSLEIESIIQHNDELTETKPSF